MKIAAVIPSRYSSKRFPGKPLVKIKGVPMIERVYRRVEKSGKFSEVIVATDDERIQKVVTRFGGRAVLTSSNHRSGTERLWEVVEKSGFDAAINIQGDEPLLPVSLVSDLYDELDSGNHQVVTAAYFNDSEAEFRSENVVKVVVDKHFSALYFSRSPVPCFRDGGFSGFYQHIGIYGYTREALEAFFKFPAAKLEEIEKLEQLRFLENGVPIRVIPSKEKSFGVDVPGDLIKIESMLSGENE